MSSWILVRRDEADCICSYVQSDNVFRLTHDIGDAYLFPSEAKAKALVFALGLNKDIVPQKLPAWMES